MTVWSLRNVTARPGENSRLAVLAAGVVQRERNLKGDIFSKHEKSWSERHQTFCSCLVLLSPSSRDQKDQFSSEGNYDGKAAWRCATRHKILINKRIIKIIITICSACYDYNLYIIPNIHEIQGSRVSILSLNFFVFEKIQTCIPRVKQNICFCGIFIERSITFRNSVLIADSRYFRESIW